MLIRLIVLSKFALQVHQVQTAKQNYHAFIGSKSEFNCFYKQNSQDKKCFYSHDSYQFPNQHLRCRSLLRLHVQYQNKIYVSIFLCLFYPSAQNPGKTVRIPPLIHHPRWTKIKCMQKLCKCLHISLNSFDQRCSSYRVGTLVNSMCVILP